MTVLSDAENQKLFEKYLSTLSIDELSSSEVPFQIVLVGLPLSGKTRFANALAERLRIHVACNDAIRRFLNQEGYAGESPVQATLEAINERLGRVFYEKQISSVLDADIIKFHAQVRQNAAKYGFKLVTVHIFCDDDTTAQRLEQRRQNLAVDHATDFSRALEETLQIRREIHAKTEYPEFDIEYDSTTSQEAAVEKVVELLRLRGCDVN